MNAVLLCSTLCSSWFHLQSYKVVHTRIHLLTFLIILFATLLHCLAFLFFSRKWNSSFISICSIIVSIISSEQRISSLIFCFLIRKMLSIFICFVWNLNCLIVILWKLFKNLIDNLFCSWVIVRAILWHYFLEFCVFW